MQQIKVKETAWNLAEPGFWGNIMNLCWTTVIMFFIHTEWIPRDTHIKTCDETAKNNRFTEQNTESDSSTRNRHGIWWTKRVWYTQWQEETQLNLLVNIGSQLMFLTRVPSSGCLSHPICCLSDCFEAAAWPVCLSGRLAGWLTACLPTSKKRFFSL